MNRWSLKFLLLNNLSLKGIALLLAITMWGFVASQQRGESTEIKFTAPLIFKNIPKTLELTSNVEESVGVLLRVRRNLARSINPVQFQAAIDLRNQLAGSFEYTLTDKNITYSNDPLPVGVDILQISPGRIALSLEPTIEKDIPIKPRFSGDLAPGFIINAISIIPQAVRVRGPRLYVNDLRAIPTHPLDVQGLKTDAEMRVTLELPPMIRLVEEGEEETFFRATISVNNNPIRILVRGIPIMFKNPRYSHKASISLLSAHLEGPRQVMSKLDRKSIFALVDMNRYPPGDYRGLSPKIVLPDTVKVLEQWPILDLFVLKRKL